MRLERVASLVGSGIAIFGALIHWAAPVMGPQWYAFLNSPAWVVESARNHTWEAPVGGLIIGTLMFLCAIYALSGTGLLRKIPLLRTGLCVISLICTVRGLLLVPFLLKVQERLTTFDILASLVWLLAGLSFLLVTVGRWTVLSESVG